MNKNILAWEKNELKESKLVKVTAKLVKGNIDAVQTNVEGRPYRTLLFKGFNKAVYFYFKKENNKIANRIEKYDKMNQTIYCEMSLILGVKDSEVKTGAIGEDGKEEVFTPFINQLYLQDIKLAELEDLEQEVD